MKRFLLAAAVAVLPSMGFADDVFGTWKTTPDDNGNFGHIKVSACGQKICGILVKAFGGDGNVMQSENVGKKIIWGMKADGDGYYSGGKVWSPDRDKTYKSKMHLTGDKLGIKGCVLGICRDGGKWTRVN